MKKRYLLTSCAALSLGLWALYSWPLPHFLFDGIPSSAQNVENPPWRFEIAGDHFQLLYYYELMRDMVTGRIPWFHNVYEFNTAGDHQRLQPGAYFFPFSFIYSLMAPVIGNAASWNAVQLMSIWLSALFAWLWLRSFTRDPWALALGTLVLLVLPFRWFSLFHGSPTGAALLWVPMLAWSIHRAVHQPAYSSGALIGAIIALCYFSDLHVFFFSVYALPLFVMISLVYRPAITGPIPWRSWYKVLPLGVVWAGVVLAYHLWRKSYLHESVSAGSRSWHELAIYSASPGYLFGPMSSGAHHKLYLGWPLVVMLLVAVVSVFVRYGQNKKEEWSRSVLFYLVFLVTIICVLLALGTEGPGHGRLLRYARDFLPYYAMIRQPAKIYAILIPLTAWLVAVGWSSIGLSVRSRKLLPVPMLLIAIWFVLDAAKAINATVAMLPERHPAYEAVARDAEALEQDPGKVMVIPIWPGESADTSYPMYLVQQSGLRMINGYNPIVSKTYRPEVFLPLQSINMGWITGVQLDMLRAMRVDYLIVHENMYREKVSPFPVNHLMRRLDADPRLEKLIRHEGVHAYRILSRPGNSTPLAESSSPALFPARRWEAERLAGEGGGIIQDPEASRHAYWTASVEDDLQVYPWCQTSEISVPPISGLLWLVRARGEALISASSLADQQPVAMTSIKLSSKSTWQWLAFPLTNYHHYGKASMRIELSEGVVDLDMALLTAGSWPEIWPRDGIKFAASDFFRSGYVDEDGQAVHFRRNADGGLVLYGPSLPLSAGRYRFELNVESSAHNGSVLGWMTVELNGKALTDRRAIIQGADNSLMFTVEHNLPVVMRLYSSRTADFTLRSVTVRQE